MSVFRPNHRERPPRTVNLPLILGVPLVAFLLFVALFGQWLSPHDPLERFYIIQDGQGAWHTPPFKPGQVSGFPLGADYIGRDLLSRLMWGVRPTFVLATTVSLARVIAGTALGFVEGWYHGRRRGDVVASLTQGVAALPLLIVAIVALMLLRLLGAGEGMLTFMIAMSLTGWASTAKLIAERVRLVRGEPYIEAARALGAGDGHIPIRHVLPQVMTLLPVVLSFEISATLLLTAELGFLGFFIGGTENYAVPNWWNGGFTLLPIPGLPELGQVLSGGWDNFFLMPWVAVYSGAVFFVSVFSFMMLGEGLKRRAALGKVRWGLTRQVARVFARA